MIVPRYTLPLPLIDLQSLPEYEREVEAQYLASAEARRPFDLSSGPLMRATLLRLGAQYHVVLLIFFSSRRRHTRSKRDWSSDVCSSDLPRHAPAGRAPRHRRSRLRDGRPDPAAAHADGGGPDGWHRPLHRHARTGGSARRRGRSEERRVGKECGWERSAEQ